MNITLPPAIPDRALGQAAYNAAVAAWLIWQVQNGAEMQALVDLLGPLAAGATDIISIANFKGSWSSLTGALNVPASVYHNGQMWTLVQNLANVTTATPGVSAAWFALGQGAWLQLVSTPVSGLPTLITFLNIPQTYADISLIVSGARPTTSGQQLALEVSVNNGASWLAYALTSASITSAQSASGEVQINGYRRAVSSVIPALGVPASNVIPNGVATFGIANGSPINAVRLSWSGGSTFAATGGSVSLFARV